MKIIRADGFGRRLIGWIGRRQAGTDEGLWLVPCRAVHTLGMRFPIDVVFLDRQGKALRIAPAVRPWRCRWHRGAHSVLELAAGGAARLGLAAGAVVRQTRGVAWSVAAAVSIALAGLLAAYPIAGFAAAPLIEETLPEIEFQIEWLPDPERLAEDVEAALARNGPLVPAVLPPTAPAPARVAQPLPDVLPLPHLAEAGDLLGFVRGVLPPMRLTRPLARDTVERLLDEADSLYRGTHWLRAMDAYQGLIEIDPSNRNAWLRIGNLHHQRNQLGPAAGAYRKAAQPVAAVEPASEAQALRAKALANLVAVNLEFARSALDDLQSIRPSPGAAATLRDGLLADLRQLETDARSAVAAAPVSGLAGGTMGAQNDAAKGAQFSVPARVVGGPRNAATARASDWTGLPGNAPRVTVEYLREAPTQSIGSMRDRTLPGS